jgi:cleavage and polyadenylation specificity factor subunit 3
MFLEAQFGADNITPIAVPRLPNKASAISPTISKENVEEDAESDASEDELEALQRYEIERLHKIGIPVPGVEIKFDKNVAKVWLENLEIECSPPSKIIEHRVKAVVERAVEVTAPLWAS